MSVIKFINRHDGFVEFLNPGWRQHPDKVWRKDGKAHLRRPIKRMFGLAFGSVFFGFFRAGDIISNEVQ